MHYGWSSSSSQQPGFMDVWPLEPLDKQAVKEYIRFEHGITFMNVAAGEDIRWLPRRQGSRLVLLGNDYWVFDEKLVLWNSFTGEGEVPPDGRELTDDPEAVQTCAAAFEVIWDRAMRVPAHLI